MNIMVLFSLCLMLITVAILTMGHTKFALTTSSVEFQEMQTVTKQHNWVSASLLKLPK